MKHEEKPKFEWDSDFLLSILNLLRANNFCFVEKEELLIISILLDLSNREEEDEVAAVEEVRQNVTIELSGKFNERCKLSD